MPSIYLSPSTQEFNEYVTSGTEEYNMNLIADAMIPYLVASGITYERNTPEMTAASSIAASNAGDFDVHIALHSNAAPGDSAGKVRGSQVYYYPTSRYGFRLAQILVENLKMIYPLPEKVVAIPTTSIGEVSKTKAVAVLIEFAYHDNVDDANWITENIDLIARNVVMSLTEYFGIPFNMPQEITTGYVQTPRGGNLNVRYTPSLSARVIGSVPNGAEVTIYNRLTDWVLAGYGNLVGYLYADYVRF